MNPDAMWMNEACALSREYVTQFPKMRDSMFLIFLYLLLVVPVFHLPIRFFGVVPFYIKILMDASSVYFKKTQTILPFPELF